MNSDGKQLPKTKLKLVNLEPPLFFSREYAKPAPNGVGLQLIRNAIVRVKVLSSDGFRVFYESSVNSFVSGRETHVLELKSLDNVYLSNLV